MEITLFNGAKDTTPDNIKLAWPELCHVASAFMREPRHRSDKLRHQAMIFGRCEGRRANANVRFLSGLCADFDIGPADTRYLPFEAMCGCLEAQGLAFIAYTTTKNHAGHHKYRLILPYAGDVPIDQCRAAWSACNAKFDCAIDGSTHDPARLSFMPAEWTGNPFHDPTHGEMTLAKPFSTIRVQVAGQPILSNGELANLANAPTPAPAKRARVPVHVAPLSAPERDKLAHGKDLSAACWALLADLHRSPLIKPWMREKLPFEDGNRDYRFMCAVAAQAIRTGLPIRWETIAVLAEQFAAELLHRPPPADVDRQAENALAWARQSSVCEAEPCQPVAGDHP